MITFSDLAQPFSLGLGIWLFTWGFNRAYLVFKSFLH